MTWIPTLAANLAQSGVSTDGLRWIETHHGVFLAVTVRREEGDGESPGDDLEDGPGKVHDAEEEENPADCQDQSPVTDQHQLHDPETSEQERYLRSILSPVRSSVSCC